MKASKNGFVEVKINNHVNLVPFNTGDEIGIEADYYEEPQLPPMPPCCVCGEPSEGAVITITNNTGKSWVTADEVKQKIDYYCKEHQTA